jgi:hypothetical protein
MATNVFRGIDRDPQAKARLAQVFGIADQKGFNDIMNEEVMLLESKRKLLERSGMNEEAVQEIDATLLKLNNRDPVAIGELVFNRLAQIAGS